MSTQLATEEDYKFFDYLASYRWPDKTPEEIQHYRDLVEHGDLQIETVLENALALTSQRYKRVALVDRDFCDGSDSKKVVSCFRQNNILKRTWKNTFNISGLRNKTGLIRAMCYSKYADKFYFFAIPNFEYNGRERIEIALDRFYGEIGDPQGLPRGKWTKYLVDNFEELSCITEDEAIKLGMDAVNSSDDALENF